MSNVPGKLILAAFVVCGLILPAAWAEELHVPGDYATIQSAIDAAQPGDEVVIAPGTYTGPDNKDLDFAGKAITVRSADPTDPAVVAGTVIDCEGEGRGFYFHSGEGPDSVVAGLTITNGHVEDCGGGVYCDDFCSPTLSHCTITQNVADGSGGGICCTSGSSALINCAITWNTGAEGGGIYCSYSTPTFSSCTVARNLGSHGIYCVYGAPTLTNCTIAGNSEGCGIYSRFSDITLSNCVVWGNRWSAIASVSASGLIATYSAIEGGWEGEGNITTDPLITPDGHLRAGSPCYNAGDPSGDYTGQTDLDGEARVLDGGADVGADEWLDSDADGLPDWWEQRYFADPLAADPLGNEDGDARNNLEEYLHSSDPLVGSRLFHVDPAGNDAWDGLAEQWDGEHGPKATIQAGIDACGRYEGAVVVAAPGVYTGPGNRELDFAGKPLTVRSIDPGDPEIVAMTVVDGGGEDRLFHFRHGEGPGSVVAGLTITGGYADTGGAVLFHYSNPTMINCVVTGNAAENGGGLCCYGSRPTLDNCAITHNVAEGEDQRSVGGGGILCYDHSHPVLNSCTIMQNTAACNGGGVCCRQSDVTFNNCALVRNGSQQYGGGLFYYEGTATLDNCTIAWNVARSGGACALHRESSALLTNCIVWSNAPAAFSSSSATATVTYSVIEGGWDGVGNIDTDPLLTPDGHLQAGSPCRDAADPEGEYAGQTDIDGEPRLLGGQADMGVDEWLDSDADGLPDWWEARYFEGPLAGDPLGDEDADGRNNLAEYNRGSDPFAGPRQLFAAVSGNDEWDGLAPAWDGVSGPKATIQAAIDTCRLWEGDEIVVAEGTYTGPGNRDLDYGGRLITVRSVAPDDPEVVAETIIDCAGEGRGFYFRRCESADAVVAGLTITHGYADYSSGGGVCCSNRSSPTLVNCSIVQCAAYGAGGGLYCGGGCEPTLTNCTIVENEAVWAGGGVSCYGDSNPTMIHCTISRNRTDGQGGGMYFYLRCNPTLIDCVIAQNTGADYGGGGIHCDRSSLSLLGCTIAQNTAGGKGGGVCCDHGSQTLAGCVIVENAAEAGGGGVSSWWSTTVVTKCVIARNEAASGGGIECWKDESTLANCMISGNTAANVGGGVNCESEAQTVLTNCTISGNSATRGAALACGEGAGWPFRTVAVTNSVLWSDGNAVWKDEDALLYVTYSDIAGGWEGEGNIDEDPLFVDPENGDFHLTADSPCIDAGDPAFVPAADEKDMDGQYRLWDGDGDGVTIVDMGADEFGSYVFGDLNCDGLIDNFDIKAFLKALTDPAGYEQQYPNCNIMLADLNGDGVVNNFDIRLFIGLLTSG